MDNMGSITPLSPDDVVNLFRHDVQPTMRRTVVHVVATDLISTWVAFVDWVFVATALAAVTFSPTTWLVLVETGFVTTALITNWSVTSPASPSPP